jgi:hypothetical protein
MYTQSDYFISVLWMKFLHEFIIYPTCSAHHITLTSFLYLNSVKPTNYYHFTFYQEQETVTGVFEYGNKFSVSIKVRRFYE